MPMQILIIILCSLFLSYKEEREHSYSQPKFCSFFFFFFETSLSFVLLEYRIKLLMCKFKELRVLISII